MAPITGIAIAFLAIAVAVRSNARLPSLWWQMCAVLPFAFGMLAVIGHAYGVHYLPNATSPFATMAVPTALSIMTLGLASLATEPDAGILRIILAERVGGRFARLVLPVAILFPIVFGWFRLLGQDAGLYDTNFGVLIMALSAIAVFSVISILSARWLNRSEDELLEAQHTLERRVQERTVELETTVTRLRAEIVLREAAEKARADSRQFLSDVIDAIPIPLTVKDDQRRLIIVNDANDRFHGRPSHDIVGKLDTDLYPPDLAEQYWAEDDAVLESGEPMIQEQAFTTMSGELRWVIKQKRRIALSDGRRWLIVTLLDITNRKQAEAALAEREAWLRLMTDSSVACIGYIDSDQRFRFCNETYRRWYGLVPEQVLGKSVREILGEDVYRRVGPFYLNALRGQRAHYERELLFDDERRHIFVDLIPDTRGDQGIRGAFVYATDITERKRAELEVERSQKFLESVIEAIPQPIFLKDSQHRWVLVNSAFCTLLGRERAELLGRSDPDIFPADWVDRVWAEDDQVLSGSGSLLTGEASERRADGSVRWLLKSKKRVTLPDESTYIVGISTDITRLKQVEEALRKSDELHRLLAENSSDLISLLDPAGVIEYASPAAIGLLDTQPEHLLGKLVTDLIHPDDLPRSLQIFADIVKKQVPVVFICRLMRSGGTWTWIETSFRAIRDADSGRTRQVIAVSRDINERVRAADALNRFKYMLDSSLDTILLYDADTLRFNYVNDGAVKTLGYPKEKLLGMAPWELRGDISITDYHKSIEPFLRGDIQSRKFESMYRRADGELIPMDVSMQLVRRAGEPGTFIAVARDATERRAVERLKNEFVSTVSHELRTPVTSIRGSLGLLAGGVAGELPEQARQLVDIAYKNSERLIRLINDILDIEKIESGKMRFAMRPVVLRSLLETPLADNRGYAEQFGVNFVLRGEIPDVLVQVDPDRIMQVMANLLSNAAKFSPRGADVEISAVAASVSVRISVTDHGGGIPQEFQSRIFGKFSQADASDSRKMGGSGLGLSIAKAIVEKHSGTVSFSSAPGRTTFFFDLPIALSGQKAEDDATGSVSDSVVN
jgi:PAS domain S-box-containing protein